MKGTFEFLAYLRGIETLVAGENPTRKQKFLAYLRGIETTQTKWADRYIATVFSVPTRDWNEDEDVLEGKEARRFLAYLQGIETPANVPSHWGPGLFLAYLQGIETVQWAKYCGVVIAFLAYLQGIETEASPTDSRRCHSF